MQREDIALWRYMLVNAYEIVHYSLIQYSLDHYHAPSKLSNLVSALYTGLDAQISSASWSTPLIRIQLGVHQGGPLSVVIFNTVIVINTLVDTLRTLATFSHSISCLSISCSMQMTLVSLAILQDHVSIHWTW